MKVTQMDKASSVSHSTVEQTKDQRGNVTFQRPHRISHQRELVWKY